MKTKTENHPMWMSKELFEEIYGRVPRLSVDLLIRSKNGELVLTKRDIEPCVGQWHLPGGTVFYGERLVEAAHRIASDEIGVEIEVGRQVGYIEYATLCNSPQKTWTVALVFEAKVIGGELRGGRQAREVGAFKELPENTIQEQADFLKTIL